MELRIFQSSNGDCLLLEGGEGGRVLCDGGMSTSMRRHVREPLHALHAQGERLDAVYVSHIDQDHITGVLQLLLDLLAWRVFEHHRARGDHAVREPDFPRPPEIDGLWHNAFHDLITRNRGAIEDLLAARAPVLFGTGLPEAMREAERMRGLAQAVKEALEVSRLVRPDLLGIPLNRPPGRPGGGQLLLVEDPNPPFEVGSLRFHLVGPSPRELRKLRRGWNNWLRKPENRETSREIRREMERRAEEFASGVRTTSPFDLRDWNGVPDFRGVTAPNTASLMFLVEDGGHSLLLTGDSQQDVILEGLEETGHLEEGHLHVDVLKVPHHGSEKNADRNFCRRVSADHYVFCGNGSHGNPEPEVLDLYFDSRLGEDPAHHALAPRARDRDFTFWFSTTADRQPRGSRRRRNFEATEVRARELAGASGGRLHLRFNDDDFVTLRP